MARKKKSRSPARAARGSFMRPEWRKKIYGEGGAPEPPPKTAEEALARQVKTQAKALPLWLRIFENVRPSPERSASGEPLSTILVPKSEREYIERMRRGGPEATRAYASFRRETPYSPSGQASTPPPPRSRPGYGPPPPAARPGPSFTPPPSGGDPLSAFDLPLLFESASRVRKDPRFRGVWGVGVVSREGRTQAERAMDALLFLKVPESEIRRIPPNEIWEKLAKPLLNETVQALNARKPADLPGRFKFDFSENGAFGLIYQE